MWLSKFRLCTRDHISQQEGLQYFHNISIKINLLQIEKKKKLIKKAFQALLQVTEFVTNMLANFACVGRSWVCDISSFCQISPSASLTSELNLTP